ncbi:RNA polymerase II degradation factor 1 isoform X2 [Eurytemora carolleeae]|nr:RNA polymerase II degradation factor 1 isoform X2 [Eurytemora carolleeae]|eukprot:XP_023342670.1 RNA polymerase II degradation factor 1-like isoform X2 [Eurytemora affinis]
MICEYMGSAEQTVVNAVTNNFGSQTGQLAQSGLSQFQSNPQQFLQNLPGQLNQNNGPLTQAVTAQLGQNSPFLQQNGQLLQNIGGQILQAGLNGGQNQFQTQFAGQNQFGNQFAGQNQFGNQFAGQNQFGNQFAGQNQFGNQFAGQNQFGNQFAGQNQFGNQFKGQNQFSQNQIGQQQQGGAGDAIIDAIAGALAGAIPGRKKRSEERRQKRQTSMHGQAIKMMQSFGLDQMGAYPFVRAAIIGHANKESPTNCRQLFPQCPDGTDQLLNYFNNHNGGLFQNAVPSATSEVGSLFPGLSALPQIAASTIGEFASSSGGSGGGGGLADLVGAESGIMNTVVDGLAGMIASAMGKKK